MPYFLLFFTEGFLSKPAKIVSGDNKMVTAYVPNHTSADIPNVVIDFLVEYGVQVLAFAGLIALITLAVWVKGNF